MSVAMGMPQPVSEPSAIVALTATKMPAGTIMPPIAAAAGTTASRTFESEPRTSSCLSSSPTTKKNTASRPSAAQTPSGRSRCSETGPTLRSTRAKYESAHGELAHTSAIAAAISSSMPPTVSSRRRSRR